jgi:HK97 family phage portal protein
MLMFKRVRDFVGSLRVKTVSGLISLYEALTLHEFQTVADYLRIGTRKVWATWKALDIIAQVVQTTPYAIYREGAKEPVKVPDLERLLRYSSERETFADLLYKTIFHLRLTGSAYWLKSEATLLGQRPKELIALNPKRVRAAVDRNGVQIGWLYRAGGRPEIGFGMDDIMHFKRPHPDNDFYGLGDYEAGEELINDMVNRQNWGRQFWKNGAAPSSVFITEEQVTDQEQFNRMKARFHEQYGGEKNAGKTAFLTGKWSMQRLGLTSQEMEEIERIKLNVEQIFQLHGVPLTVAGIREAANYATAEIDDQRFRTYSVWPMVKLIMDTMNTDLVKGWGENLTIRFDVAGLVDVGKVVRDLAPLFDRGVISVNEMRMKAGFQPIKEPQFDQHFISAGLVPYDLAGVADLGQTDDEAEKTVRRFLSRTHRPQLEQ